MKRKRITKYENAIPKIAPGQILPVTEKMERCKYSIHNIVPREDSLIFNCNIISIFKSMKELGVFCMLVRENDVCAINEDYKGTFACTYSNLISHFPEILNEKDIDKSFKKATKLGLMIAEKQDSDSFLVTLEIEKIREIFEKF